MVQKRIRQAAAPTNPPGRWRSRRKSDTGGGLWRFRQACQGGFFILGSLAPFASRPAPAALLPSPHLALSRCFTRPPPGTLAALAVQHFVLPRPPASWHA